MRILAGSLLLAACGGGPLVQTGDGGPPPAGAVRLEGASDAGLDLGDVLLGEERVAAVVVRNPGPGPLDLRAVALEGDGLRWASAPRTGVLAPGQATQLAVAYRGRRDESVRGAIRLQTDAPGQETVVVAVEAEGLAPRLVLPAVLEVGDRTQGCPAAVAVPLKNTGRMPLRLWGTAVDGADLLAEPPATLAPGADAVARLGVDAVSAGRTKALLVVRSDDPDAPVGAATASWVGSELGLDRATYEQSGDGQIDVVLAVPSGEDALRARLATALPAVLAALDASTSGWRLAVVSGIGGPDPVWVEAGQADALPRLLDALAPWDGADSSFVVEAARRFLEASIDFRRPRAGLRLAFVAAGSDPSFGLFEADELAGRLQAGLVQPEDLRTWAVAPLGDCAEPADELVGLVEQLDGDLVDACASDWAPALVGLAAEHRAASFWLPEAPPLGAPVWVDLGGVPAVGWALDGARLRFADGAVPPNGAWVDVRWLDPDACAP